MNDSSYKNWYAMSDKALARQIGQYIRHHRINQNKTQSVLAKEAGISRSTLSLLERGESVNLSTLIQVLRVLNQLEVMNIFTVQQVISPMVMAKMEKYARKRASGTAQKDELPKTDW